MSGWMSATWLVHPPIHFYTCTLSLGYIHMLVCFSVGDKAENTACVGRKGAVDVKY